MIRAREDGKYVVVMQSGDDSTISGLSVLASADDKAVFVNLMGEFEPEEIAELAAAR